MIGAPGRVDTVQLTEKTDKGRALARPRKGSFSGANAEKQADDPLRGLGELGVDHLEQGLGIPTIGAELVQGEGQPAGGGLGVLADGKGGAERGASGGVLSHRRPADGDRLADGAAAQCQPQAERTAAQGKQETGGYSITVPELYLTDNSIIVKTELKGPERSEPTGEEPSYPYIVLRTELLEEPVVFQ